jgi:hypothetical protein
MLSNGKDGEAEGGRERRGSRCSKDEEQARRKDGNSFLSSRRYCSMLIMLIADV